MKDDALLSFRRIGPVFLSLVLASGVGVALVFVRFVASHQPAYFNFIWN